MKEFLIRLKELFFTFDGRLNRSPYFGLGIVLSLIYLILYIAILVTDSTAVFITCIILLLPLMIAGISLTIRRLHDLNHSGWLLLIRLIQFIPIPVIIDLAMLVFELYLLFKKGTDGPNDYGDDPLEIDTFKYQSYTGSDDFIE